MRRRALAFCFYAMIGLAITIAVAWACAFRARDGAYDSPPACFGVVSIYGSTWSSGSNLPMATYQRAVVASAIDAINSDNAKPHPPLVAWPNNRANCFGWPLYCLWYQFVDRGSGRAIHVLVEGDPALEFKPSGTGPAGFQPVAALPLRPLWLGLAGNVLFYGLACWLALTGPTRARRWLRRSRGLCARCGYDLRHASHERCPECGAAIPQALTSCAPTPPAPRP